MSPHGHTFNNHQIPRNWQSRIDMDGRQPLPQSGQRKAIWVQTLINMQSYM